MVDVFFLCLFLCFCAVSRGAIVGPLVEVMFCRFACQGVRGSVRTLVMIFFVRFSIRLICSKFRTVDHTRIPSSILPGGGHRRPFRCTWFQNNPNKSASSKKSLVFHSTLRGLHHFRYQYTYTAFLGSPPGRSVITCVYTLLLRRWKNPKIYETPTSRRRRNGRIA